MIHIAIVEDDKKTRSCLQRFLEQYEKESGNKFTIHIFEDGIDIVNDYRCIYDVILMDIQMKKMDGMTAAREIRKTDSEVILVFITNMVQYAVNGYAVNALDFILKPLNYFTFAQHMKRIEIYLENKLKNYLVLNTGGGILKIDTNEIYYLESLGHYIHIHKKKEVISVLETMKNMEQALSSSGFFRCNNGYLVNLAYVEKVDKYTALVGTDEIQISRPKKKAFMEALTDYLGGMGK
ncbi:MAG: response regulator transcription factor [Lachnospiraceae bacterium]|nr:response regulator transcription factor [Lachnospiraceae bacterium]